MKLNIAAFLPLVTKLGDYLRVGFDHYVALKASGTELSADMLGAFLAMQMGSWNPDFQGKKLLDDETRQAAARFLAGVILNLANDKR
jgi:hypothetical protein